MLYLKILRIFTNPPWLAIFLPRLEIDPGYLPLEDSPCSALKEPANKKHTPEPGRRFPSSSSVLPVPCAGHCLQDNEG